MLATPRTTTGKSEKRRNVQQSAVFRLDCDRVFLARNKFTLRSRIVLDGAHRGVWKNVII